MYRQSGMDDNFDTLINEVAEVFEHIPTTEDTRTGIERRHQVATDFPIKDSSGSVVDNDRRSQEDRRNQEVDIDDISEYVQLPN
ncbi:MAG: hypothetical protein AB8B92_07965 [Gammaproteobacteria bacterium]